MQNNLLLTRGAKRARSATYRFVLLTGRFFVCPAGATRCTDEGEIWQGGADLQINEQYGRYGPNMGQFYLHRLKDVGFRPQNFENLEIYQYYCTILTKFTEFMRVLSLHKSAKFGCFVSVNEKKYKQFT